MPAIISLPSIAQATASASSMPPAHRGSRDERLSPGDFELFIREYSGRLLAVAKRLLRSEHDAADAIQDAFLSAFLSRHRFNGNSTVYTWLYRIVVNTCLMKIRSRSQLPTVSLSELSPVVDDGRRSTGGIPMIEGSAAHRLDSEETRALVRECINRLPDAPRAILLMRDIEGLDTDATAALLNLSRNAVKTRLHRARLALRTLLEDALSS